jgi:hypothetical protein
LLGHPPRVPRPAPADERNRLLRLCKPKPHWSR